MKKVVIHLETGIDLSLNDKLKNTQLMSAIGMLTQLLTQIHVEKYNETTKLKNMLNEFTNKIIDEVCK